MIWVKVSLFVLTVMSVKLIFKYINDYGDMCVKNMRELLEFTDYLRVYSCRMHMSLQEISASYGSKNENINKICLELMRELNSYKNKSNFADYVGKLLHTPADFNVKFSYILDYYGKTYTEVLDNKLDFTISEMEKTMKLHEDRLTDKKNLNNRISLLVGCLAAVILI